MKKLNFNWAHLLGIGGVGMSSLGVLLAQRGDKITGSDCSNGRFENLAKNNIKAVSPHPDSLAEGIDLLVYSSAIRRNHPLLIEANNRGMTCLTRTECLSQLMLEKSGIIITGTHGKTSTSAFSAVISENMEAPISYYVGASMPSLGNACAKWEDEEGLLIIEADESDGMLEYYSAEYGIFLNSDLDHVDYYQDVEEIKSIYKRAMNQVSRGIIYCNEDLGLVKMAESYTYQKISYGWKGANYSAQNLQETKTGSSFDFYHYGDYLGSIEIGLRGKHQVLNAVASLALMDLLNLPWKEALPALREFSGASRRFERKSVSKVCEIIDDYAHHPVEVKATLEVARSYNPKRLIAVFQPHRYTRMRHFIEEFSKVLVLADFVFITEIYAAGEKQVEGIDSEFLVKLINKANSSCFAELVEDSRRAHCRVGNFLKEGDMLITLGAGNVGEIAEKIGDTLNLLVKLTKGFEENVTQKIFEPMSRHTTLGVGGAAQLWIAPQSVDALVKLIRRAKKLEIDVNIMGRGSNLLVKDGGISGIMIVFQEGELAELKVERNLIRVGAGVKLKKLVQVAYENNLAGFEWMEGIPGTVGGAARMNAGAMGEEFYNQVESLLLLDKLGKIVKKEGKLMKYGYREVDLKDYICVLEVTLWGEKGEKDLITQRLKEFRKKRHLNQPIGKNAGCIFKNFKGFSAGELIDNLGLKGINFQGVSISKLHGNFMLNQGNAKAADVLELIEKVKSKVRAEMSVDLALEIQVIGDDVSNEY